jgi:hypothetical protein
MKLSVLYEMVNVQKPKKLSKNPIHRMKAGERPERASPVRRQSNDKC